MATNPRRLETSEQNEYQTSFIKRVAGSNNMRSSDGTEMQYKSHTNTNSITDSDQKRFGGTGGFGGGTLPDVPEEIITPVSVRDRTEVRQVAGSMAGSNLAASDHVSSMLIPDRGE